MSQLSLLQLNLIPLLLETFLIGLSSMLFLAASWLSIGHFVENQSSLVAQEHRNQTSSCWSKAIVYLRRPLQAGGVLLFLLSAIVIILS
jgi:hypothetical protein